MHVSRLGAGRWVKFRPHGEVEFVIGYVDKDVEDNEGGPVVIWCKSKELDAFTMHNNAPWDFSVKKMEEKSWKTLWHPKYFKVHDETDFEIIEDQDYDVFKFQHQYTDIVRAADDRIVTYGDGGWSALMYPIWYCERPNIDYAIRSRLLRQLRDMSYFKKDIQEGTPVEDIIDPDLGPYRIPNFSSHTSEPINIRSSYHWLPSEFLVKKDGTVRILSRIHNIRSCLSEAPLYSDIAKVFEGMVPMFKKLNLIHFDTDTTLQVIVKAQRYRLERGMSYAGRWHLEGLTENIVAVGVYYLEVEHGLVGGKLKFRPAEAPQHWYNLDSDVELEAKEGTAVVFSNILPHRFRKIVNNTNSIKDRTFLNFFIVDPSKPLTSTREIPSTEFLIDTLSQASFDHDVELPKPILKQILSYLPYVWVGKKEAKRFRKQARESMKAVKSGWGWIDWGNCGTVEFVSSEDNWKNRSFAESLQHTESDTPQEK